MSLPNRYRKKPVEIEAIRLQADPVEYAGAKLDGADVAVAVASGWMLGYGFRGFKVHGDRRPFGIAIETLEGVMVANPGDWIICGVAGEFYPCRDDIFQQTYEPVL